MRAKKFRSMKTKIRPVGERVVVKPIEAVEKTPSGIYIPETAKEKPSEGEVIAIGKLEDVEIKVGDKILYSKYAGTKYEIDGEEYLILEKNDILAVLS